MNTTDLLIKLCLFMRATRNELIIKLTFSVSKYAKYFLVRSSTNHRFFQFLRTSEQKKNREAFVSLQDTVQALQSRNCIS